MNVDVRTFTISHPRNEEDMNELYTQIEDYFECLTQLLRRDRQAYIRYINEYGFPEVRSIQPEENLTNTIPMSQAETGCFEIIKHCLNIFISCGKQ